MIKCIPTKVISRKCNIDGNVDHLGIASGLTWEGLQMQKLPGEHTPKMPLVASCIVAHSFQKCSVPMLCPGIVSYLAMPQQAIRPERGFYVQSRWWRYPSDWSNFSLEMHTFFICVYLHRVSSFIQEWGEISLEISGKSYNYLQGWNGLTKNSHSLGNPSSYLPMRHQMLWYNNEATKWYVLQYLPHKINWSGDKRGRLGFIDVRWTQGGCWGKGPISKYVILLIVLVT